MREGCKGTAAECIVYLAGQKDGTFEVKPFEKRSLQQNDFYWLIVQIIAKALKKPRAYVHNILLRRNEVYDTVNGFPICVPLPDDDKTELWVEYNDLHHYKPTLSFYETEKGKFRWYKRLKGSKEFSVSEMTRLIDLALDELNNMELMLPQDEETLKAYEKHQERKRKSGDKIQTEHSSNEV